MKLFWALVVLAVPVFSATAPNRYIVELSTEPVALHVRAQGRQALRSAAATAHRGRIRSEQATAQTAIEQAGGHVSRGVENLKNALLVTMDDAQAAQLASVPGVRKVYPVRMFRMLLDHALALHRVPDAWTQVGIGNAGAGARIAIIDSGIDNQHPGFNDGGFTAPDGFPKGDSKYTNNKVIVARSYVSMLPNADPDLSPADHVGHGTATAMAAAGVQAVGPLATISGVAPRAYIGTYKVFGSPSANPSASEDAIIAAIDDAIGDGMDVLNLSLGFDVAFQLDSDPEQQALENAAALGVIVVCAAGNNGNDPMTVGSPAAAPSVIAVGATGNDRIFSSRAIAGDGQQYRAQAPSSLSDSTVSVSGPLADITPLDSTALGCSAFPANALSGSIALISRGTCTFETKVNNAGAAGAVGVLIYNNVDSSLAPWTMGGATLPAVMISMAEGQGLVKQLAAPLTMTLDFSQAPVYTDPAHLESFSAAGPNIDFAVKPDMVAVGGNVYTAAQKLDGAGVVYSATGFAVESGTSFSSPIVAGAAALVKAARPGLTSAQYRSLLVNTAAASYSTPGTQSRVQQAGTGSLDVLAAVNATAAAAPVSLTFGASTGTVALTRTLTVSNVGTAADTFQLSVAPLDGGSVPELPYTSVQLDPGASVDIPVRFAADGLAAGIYDGFVQIQGTQSSVTTRVPYWHGVASGHAARVTILNTSNGGRAGSTIPNAMYFRVTDENGLPVVDARPKVVTVSGGGSVSDLFQVTGAPYTFDTYVRLGTHPGANVFRIQVGDLTRDVTINGQ
jgi:minor extracellular serine protease Vpr